MNLAGKILVVALFIMSAMFATFSIMVYSAQHNWRDEIVRTAPVGNEDVGLKEQYNRKTVENERLTTQRNNLEEQLRNDKGLKIQALTNLEAMSVALNAEFAARRATQSQGSGTGGQHHKATCVRNSTCRSHHSGEQFCATKSRKPRMKRKLKSIARSL